MEMIHPGGFFPAAHPLPTAAQVPFTSHKLYGGHHTRRVWLEADLPAELVAAALAAPVRDADARSDGASRGAIPTLADVELAHIRRVLEVCGGNRTVAAQHLGITRQTLTKKIGASEDG